MWIFILAAVAVLALLYMWAKHKKEARRFLLPSDMASSVADIHDQEEDIGGITGTIEASGGVTRGGRGIPPKKKTSRSRPSAQATTPSTVVAYHRGSTEHLQKARRLHFQQQQQQQARHRRQRGTLSDLAQGATEEVQEWKEAAEEFFQDVRVSPFPDDYEGPIGGYARVLKPGQFLTSMHDKCYALVNSFGILEIREGGNWRKGTGRIKWTSEIEGATKQPQGKYFAIAQYDGNLCIFRGQDEAHQGILVWSAFADRTSPKDTLHLLRLTDSGSLELLRLYTVGGVAQTKRIWTSNNIEILSNDASSSS